ncbi:hypothetical protein PTT_10407 [Pyrenophora teres f. teres 0-1]|uniref:Uncharacterized protein n=1 Tax=Pyrenophora teres f. teres (strain 0-1) TaxID=861557 RepID=E3RP73_PYRTT|nr:hypothetical protein PTT_10407 [Pyrenophora teres f. teres 0-1]
MSRDIRGFFTKINSRFNMATQLKAAWDAGGRIVPSRNSKNDQEFQLRIDAGDTHAKLATVKFDTQATDPEAEATRALADFESQATENI